MHVLCCAVQGWPLLGGTSILHACIVLWCAGLTAFGGNFSLTHLSQMYRGRWPVYLGLEKWMPCAPETCCWRERSPSSSVFQACPQTSSVVVLMKSAVCSRSSLELQSFLQAWLLGASAVFLLPCGVGRTAECAGVCGHVSHGQLTVCDRLRQYRWARWRQWPACSHKMVNCWWHCRCCIWSSDGGCAGLSIQSCCATWSKPWPLRRQWFGCSQLVGGGWNQ